jgi:hypothetical protein
VLHDRRHLWASSGSNRTSTCSVYSSASPNTNLATESPDLLRVERVSLRSGFVRYQGTLVDHRSDHPLLLSGRGLAALGNPLPPTLSMDPTGERV